LSVPLVEVAYPDPNSPNPCKPQPEGEPNVPITSQYPNNRFPFGATMLYNRDFNTYRTTSEEKRRLQALTESDVQPFRQAAEVHRIVRTWARTWIKPGMKYIDIADKIENKCRELLKADGFKRGMAFPCGLSFNNIAAHWAPNIGDKTVLKASDVVKVDFGTQVDGHIIDSAWTFTFDPKFQPLLDAVRAATYKGIEVFFFFNFICILKMAGIDVPLCEIGDAIQEVMESHEVTINGKTHPG